MQQLKKETLSALQQITATASPPPIPRWFPSNPDTDTDTRSRVGPLPPPLPPSSTKLTFKRLELTQLSQTPLTPAMELDLALALPNTDPIKKLNLNGAAVRSKKRSFDGDDDGDDGCSNNLENPHGLNKPKRVLIGWPPIKCRKNDINNNNGANNGRNRFVKVKMEGAAIGRKVDLSIIGSYGALRCALRRLFPDPSCTKNYVVTYEDEEGDWMLVGDVPWETFILSVKRLKILGNQSQ